MGLPVDVTVERRVLAALARGVLGEIYDPAVPDEILRFLAEVPSERDRDKLLRTLRMIDARVGAKVLTGRAVPVSWLGARDSEALIQKWRASRVQGIRQLAGAVVTLALAALYGNPGPEWAHIGYPGPYGDAPEAPPSLDPIEIDRDERVVCDVVIVGSGPGGSCVASHLARAGLDVVILEKGGYYSERDFHHVEARAMRELYLYGGTLTSDDGAVRIFAGSTVGGGALVNYTISFPPPERVRHQWSAISGSDVFVSDEFDESLTEVETKLNVNRDSSALNPRERFMEEGLKHLGWHIDQMPRAVKGCAQDEQCGYCGFGCRLGAKQGPRVYLEDAVDAGVDIYTRADVRRVDVSAGRATGVEARVGRHRLDVSARKAVVVAAGAIESPALLLRSGLRREVGLHLHLHPGFGICGLFEDEGRPWEGVQMSRYSTQAQDWDDGYGPIYESVPIHPIPFSAITPWESARQHRDGMSNYRNLAVFGPLLRDRSEGRVSLDRRGGLHVDYRLNRSDEERAVRAVIEGAKVYEAAGARKIWTLHALPISYEPSRPGAYEDWAGRVRTAGYKPSNSFLASFHQMGTCRMGVDPSSSVVGPDNQSHEVRDLYVTDGSNFPDASGVNPMLSIFGIANRAGKKLAEKLA